MKGLPQDDISLEEDLCSSSAGSLMDSKTSQLDDILQEKLEQAFYQQALQGSFHDIAKIAEEHTPIDLAYAIMHLPPQVRPVLYDNLPSCNAKIEFIVNTDSDTRLIIFRYMKDSQLKQLVETMSTDESVKVLEDLSERRFRRIMEIIDQELAANIKELKEHHRNSAGRLMTSEFFSFYMDMTVGDVASYIRDYPRIDFTRGIYILNHKKELLGFVPGRNLIINPAKTLLKQVMRPVLHHVIPEATREEVADIVERYKLSSLPVVDSDHHLVGVIAHEDVIEAMEDLADETMARIGGTVEKVTLTEPIVKRFFARSPWLLVTLIAGLVNVGVMSAFQSQEGGVLTFVLFFVPLITGMSGNIGIQCSTVLVRSMAIGAMSCGNRKEMIFKELSIGIFSGAIFSLGVMVVVFLVDMLAPGCMAISPLVLSMIIGVGLMGACFAGTFLGVMSPLLFVKMGIDPAIAAGPIVTAFNDFLSMTIYFIIAWGLGTVFFG
jgi:magnesium transporter